MEACAGAHYLARALRDQGHDARLMPAQYVKPYLKTNKNDYLDAMAAVILLCNAGKLGTRFLDLRGSLK